MSRRACSPNTVFTAVDLDRVAGGRRGAVGVDVLHVFGAHAGVFERALHRARRAFAVHAGRGHVVGVPGRAVAAELAERAVAPRRRACSSLSRTSTPAPSPITKPSRSWSNGRLARCGSSFRVERARALPKPASAIGVMVASLPPATITSASPARMRRSASPIACAPEAHAETVPKFGPSQSELDRDLSRGHVRDHHRDEERADAARAPCSSRFACWSSNVSMPPMPEPMMTPTRSRSTVVQIEPGGRDRLVRWPRPRTGRSDPSASRPCGR